MRREGDISETEFRTIKTVLGRNSRMSWGMRKRKSERVVRDWPANASWLTGWCFLGAMRAWEAGGTIDVDRGFQLDDSRTGKPNRARAQ